MVRRSKRFSRILTFCNQRLFNDLNTEKHVSDLKTIKRLLYYSKKDKFVSPFNAIAAT